MWPTFWKSDEALYQGFTAIRGSGSCRLAEAARVREHGAGPKAHGRMISSQATVDQQLFHITE